MTLCRLSVEPIRSGLAHGPPLEAILTAGIGLGLADVLNAPRIARVLS
jgi:hypothetical protein